MPLKYPQFQEKPTSCSRCVGVVTICKYCSGKLTKHGVSTSGKRRLKCKICYRTQLETYSYNACNKGLNNLIISLTKEGLGIRSTARILRISTTTLIRRIKHIAATIEKPVINKAKTYEVDEVKTFIKRKDKLIWIVCAMERLTRQIVSFNIGPRTNKTLSVVLKTLMYANATRIYTDGLKHYRYLIDPIIHRVYRYGTNHIERKNLTLRIHLKRLNRKTICFSRSLAMLRACLMIYFFC